MADRQTFDSSLGRDNDLLYQSEQVKERDFFRWQKRASERAGRVISTEEFAALTSDQRREAAGVKSGNGGAPTLALDSGRASLSDRFVVPPFSVLDTRQGYWQERKREWAALGIQSELGRPLAASGADAVDYTSVSRDGVAGRSRAATTLAHITVGTAPDISDRFEASGYGTSIFDPVLCELAYRWFAPAGGLVLDPFAGGSVRGVVASRLGHPYLGIDLSLRQVEANREQGKAICTDPMPEWVHGDSRAVLTDRLPMADLVFTCPPYFDLEVYGSAPGELSAMTWGDFIAAYSEIILLACGRLRVGRFAVIVVSEIRDQAGTYRGLVPATIDAFVRAGMRFYNEAILVNAIGSLPIRIGRQFGAGRKLGRTHQNVLVFAKGEPERGWSYEREAPPSPQLSWLEGMA